MTNENVIENDLKFQLEEFRFPDIQFNLTLKSAWRGKILTHSGETVVQKYGNLNNLGINDYKIIVKNHKQFDT